MPELPLTDLTGTPSEPYSRQQTVPANNTQIPKTNPPIFQPQESSPTVIQHAKNNAIAALKRKSRKQNELILRMPLTFQFEAGTRYNVSGFSPDIDSKDWIVHQVEFSMSGKHGSETTVIFQPSMAHIVGQIEGGAKQLDTLLDNALVDTNTPNYFG